jgi:hypothetical protein
MGDLRFKTIGKRKYFGLHDEALDIPWTAKKRKLHGDAYDARLRPYDVSEITPNCRTPYSPNLLGNINRTSRTIRKNLEGHQT